MIRNQVRRLPCAGGKTLGALERRRLRSGVDALRQGRHVQPERVLAERLAHLGIGGRAALVARDVEAPRLSSRIGAERLEVGRRLSGGRRQASRRVSERRLAYPSECARRADGHRAIVQGGNGKAEGDDLGETFTADLHRSTRRRDGGRRRLRGDDNKDSGSKANVPASLTVGSDIPYPPFEFGKPPYEGFDVDVVNEIAKGLGSKATFNKTPFDTIFRDLAQGKFDMVASASTITPEREKTVDFSTSYFPADQSLMVKKGSPIKTVDDVAGKVIGAQLGTTGADYAKNKTKAKTVRTYDLVDDAFNALEAGQIEAVINDCPVSKYAEKAHSDLVVVEAIQTNELYGIAFAKGSDDLAPP